MSKQPGNTTDRLPAKPFQDWLDRRFAHYEHKGVQNPSAAVCREVGWLPEDAGARRLYRYRRSLTDTKTRVNGVLRHGPSKHTDSFARCVIEEALHHAGIGLWELYPDLPEFQDDTPPRYAWCENCLEECLVDEDQVCLWCDHPTHELKAA